MNGFLSDLFKSMPREHVYLFVNRDGAKIGSIKTAWNNTTEKAGIEDLRFHDLRHTVATHLSMAQVPESVIAVILGHKRTTMTSRYINPHWQGMVEAVEELGKLCHRFDNEEN
jgi:integrase